MDGVYWGAAGFLRDRDRSWFTEDDVRFLASLSEPIAGAFRRALLTACVATDAPCASGPGVAVFDEHGRVDSISPEAEHWIAQLVEVPPPAVPADSKLLQGRVD